MKANDLEIYVDHEKYTKADVISWARNSERSVKSIWEQIKDWSDKQWAVFAYFDFDSEMIDEISDLDIDTWEVNVGGQYLRVLYDNEADDAEDEELDRYLEDIVYSEIPEYLRYYFDDEKWKSDCCGCRGENLAHYDSQEREYKVDDELIYIYRN